MQNGGVGRSQTSLTGKKESASVGQSSCGEDSIRGDWIDCGERTLFSKSACSRLVAGQKRKREATKGEFNALHPPI